LPFRYGAPFAAADGADALRFAPCESFAEETDRSKSTGHVACSTCILQAVFNTEAYRNGEREDSLSTVLSCATLTWRGDTESALNSVRVLVRLLDLVAQCRDPFVILPTAYGAKPIEVSGPSDFARQIVECPLRFVIADDLTRASAELAFADGDRLASCLDLLRIPAPLLWVEWNDAVHQQVICECGIVAQRDRDAFGRHVGVLLRASQDGRSATVRTFWSVGAANGQCEAQMSPLETYIDLDDRFVSTGDPDAMLRGHYASVTYGGDAGVADLLQRVRFQFDDKWLNYYSAAAQAADVRQRVARASLAAVAHDIPLLLAFFLLLNAQGATRRMPVARGVLNRKRVERDRAPLLDHVEVHASLPELSRAQEESAEVGSRRSPRLHHVRGHLVRREDRVFWRTPHLRGNALQGVVRSRTVCLSFRRAN